jgi:ADP-ribosylglycohydrolase
VLIELAIGDAYGAGFEYAPYNFIQQHNHLAGYVVHPRHTLTPGCYTDDTQMSLAVAEAIVAETPWTPESLAQHFVTAFQRDQRPGYAQGFYAFLLTVKDGEDFLERIRPTSDKSGAAMRAAPIGIFPTVEEVVERCQVQAALTHNTPSGINAAVAAALLSHYFLYNLGPKAEVGHWLEQQVPGPWSRPWRGKVGTKGQMSVQAAVTGVLQSNQLSDLLRRCVAFGGDVDTVAAIALAAGACSREMSNDLPDHLHRHLERGPYGYEYLANLDEHLLRKVRYRTHSGGLDAGKRRSR